MAGISLARAAPRLRDLESYYLLLYHCTVSRHDIHGVHIVAIRIHSHAICPTPIISLQQIPLTDLARVLLPTPGHASQSKNKWNYDKRIGYVQIGLFVAGSDVQSLAPFSHVVKHGNSFSKARRPGAQRTMGLRRQSSQQGSAATADAGSLFGPAGPTYFRLPNQQQLDVRLQPRHCPQGG